MRSSLRIYVTWDVPFRGNFALRPLQSDHCFSRTQRRRTHFSLPVLALIFPACSLVSSRLVYSNTWETLSALLSKLKNHGFDQLVSQRNWHHLLDEKLGFGGTWLPCRNVRSWLHDGRVGEVAGRVSGGSFRGGHWRYLPIRNHDNRSSADWIRLCPGLSKNSENGNSCPKPHKAARHDWSSGQSGQHWDWDY